MNLGDIEGYDEPSTLDFTGRCQGGLPPEGKRCTRKGKFRARQKTQPDIVVWLCNHCFKYMEEAMQKV